MKQSIWRWFSGYLLIFICSTALHGSKQSTSKEGVRESNTNITARSNRNHQTQVITPVRSKVVVVAASHLKFLPPTLAKKEVPPFHQFHSDPTVSPLQSTIVRVLMFALSKNCLLAHLLGAEHVFSLQMALATLC
jgi:hypothetical protein